MNEFFHSLWQNIQLTTIPEYIAVVSGILSVWFSRKENILVYPVGLASTVIYIFLSFNAHLFGEASVNFYYTVMSIYGWIVWAKRNKLNQHVTLITFSTKKEWIQQLVFFAVCYLALYLSLSFLKTYFAGAIPWADAFASGTAFTGMWLMARKKVESWYWWIVTDFASIPLYYIKGYPVTSIYYLILLILAVFGLISWIQKGRNYRLGLSKD